MDKWLNSQWFVRVVALLMACLMWMVVNFESPPDGVSEDTKPTIIDGVEITVKYDKDKYDVVSQLKPVRLAIRSDNPFYRYYYLDPEQYRIFVDVRGLGKGTHRVPVHYEGFPAGVRVDIIPGIVDVTLEEKQTVQKEVEVELIGKAAEGYTAGIPIAKPFRVHVNVPESQLNNIGKVTATVNIDGATEDIETTRPLKVLDKAGNVMPKAQVNPLTVEVTVPISNPFVVVPLELEFKNDLPDGYSLSSVEMNKDEVTVYGPMNVVQQLNTYPGPTIDLSKISNDSVLQLKIPMLKNIVKVDPEYVVVTVKIAQSETKTLTDVPIRITGLGKDVQARILDDAGGTLNTLSFEAVGAPENLRGLTAQDVQIVADVSNLPVGVHQVPIIYNLPNYVEVSPAALKQVTVEITNR